MTMSAERPWVDRCVAELAQGRLRGVYEDGVRLFRGVPYAEPPVGERRFRAPGPAPTWEGERPAHTAGPAPMQINGENMSRVMAMMGEMVPQLPGNPQTPPYGYALYNQANISEDCLYLDIWVPDQADTQPLPVYVYYHGGANEVSSGSYLRERGATLAREGEVIVVRPNYRLSALGWLHVGLIDERMGEAVNLGFQDQLAALRWVHDNIASFGGDPDQITIGGESTGASTMSHMLTSPAARPLYRRAVVQSFLAFEGWSTQEKTEAQDVARQILDLVGITDATELMSVDTERLLAAQVAVLQSVGPDVNAAWRTTGAVVDGTIVPEMPLRYLTSDAAADDLQDKQLIFGFGKDEWQFWRSTSDTLRSGSRESTRAVLTQVFSEDEAESILDFHLNAVPDDPRPGRALSDAMTFVHVKWGMLAVALNLSRQVPSWVFQFSWDLPGMGGLMRATHTGDIPFLWGTYTPEDIAALPPFQGIDLGRVSVISAAIRAMYVEFMRTGNPGADWQAFDRDGWNILWFGEQLEMRPGLLRDEWDLMTGTKVHDISTLADILTANGAAARQQAFRS